MAALSQGRIDDEELKKGELQSFAQFAFISSAGMMNKASNGGTCRGFNLIDIISLCAVVVAFKPPQLTSI